MKNIFKIIRADLRHIKTNVIALCVIIGLTVIPALYSWFNILSNWDPYGQASTSRIKVAVVSVDKGTSLEGTELNVGDTIIDALKTNNTIGWQFVASSDEAIEGVYSGDVSLFPDVFQEYQQALPGEPGVSADVLPGEGAA